MRRFRIRHVARLLRSATLGIALAGAMACNDDDGRTLFAPERGLAGMWVRYQPPPPPGLPVALPRRIDDTLFIAMDLSGHWSREVEGSAGIVPLRSTTLVQVKQEGMILLLYPLVEPCPACEVSQEARFNTVETMTPYRVVRTDGDHLEITSTGRSEFGTPTYYYERRQLPGFMPD